MDLTILQEAFKALNTLNEEDFNLNTDEISKLDDFEFDDDISISDIDDIEIIDQDAVSEKDIQDSYEGKIILDCTVCHSKLYKDPSEIEIDDDGNVVNVDLECPFCYSTDGFKIIGQVEGITTEEIEEIQNEESEDEAPESEIELDDIEISDEDSEDDISSDGELVDVEVEDDLDIDDDMDESFMESFNLNEANNTVNGMTSGTTGGNMSAEASAAGRQAAWQTLKSKFTGGKSGVNTLKSNSTDTGHTTYNDKVSDDGDYGRSMTSLREIELRNQMAKTRAAAADKFATQGHKNDGDTKIMGQGDINKANNAANNTTNNTPTSNTSSTSSTTTNTYTSGGSNNTQPAEQTTTTTTTTQPAGPGAGSPDYNDGQTRVIGFDQTKDNFNGVYHTDDATRGLEAPMATSTSNVNNDTNESLTEDANTSYIITSNKFNPMGKIDYVTFNTEDSDYSDDILSSNIDDAATFNSYEEAEDYLVDIIGDFFADDTLVEDFSIINKIDESLNEDFESFDEYLDREYGIGSADLTDNDYDNLYAEYEENRKELKPHSFKKPTKKIKEAVIDKDWDANVVIEEAFESATISTDNEIMSMNTTPEGGITVSTQPINKTELEVLAPVSDETISEIENNSDEEVEDNTEELISEEPTEGEESQEEVDVPMDEFDEESFDGVSESYLKNVYENVNSYKTTAIKSKGDKLFIEGIIKFNSGNNRKTSFILEAKDITKSGKARFVCENNQLTNNTKAFTVSGNINNKKFITESFDYNYKARNSDGKMQRISGKEIVKR